MISFSFFSFFLLERQNGKQMVQKEALNALSHIALCVEVLTGAFIIDSVLFLLILSVMKADIL